MGARTKTPGKVPELALTQAAWRLLPPLGAGLALAWLGGFLWFVHAVQVPAGTDARADGIVVLTGGADRIAAGLRLLQAGQGRALLISGVGKGAELARLARQAGVDPASLAGRITLGRAATSTTGNADETAQWARDEKLHSLLVVTASYHMMRAMTELQRTLPGLVLLPAPVLPPALRSGSGSFSTVRLLAHEYTKWLVSELGLTRLEAEAGKEPG
jgi:uncharacterized SAM-binding protein YcdF (DUF218 family)